jgi:hypothetical protein
VKNTTDADLLNLLPYVDEPPFEMKNWTYNPKNMVGPVNALHRVKGELRDAGLTTQDIVACFISRRVSPLQHRSHKICQMSGAMDPTRHSTHELSPANILRWVKDIWKSSQVTFAWGLEPYSRDRPAPTVNLFSRYFCLLPDISMLKPTYRSPPILKCLIRHTSIAKIPLVSDQLALSYAEIQLPGYGELPD